MHTMNTAHPASAGTSQTAKILARLREAKGLRVGMPELVEASGSYNIHSRISSLREQGYCIFNATKRQGTVCVSEYWLVEKQEAAA